MKFLSSPTFLSAKDLKKFTAVLFIIFTHFAALAQKLPGVQQNSLRAPANIKIDGKADEWDNKLQAYNRATGVFYTIANDSRNLYFIIQVKDPLVQKKIVKAGVTIVISKTEQKNERDAVALTFPVLTDQSSGAIGTFMNQIPGTTSAEDLKSKDSLIQLMNTQLQFNSKFIKLSGTNIATDSSISVYNDIGIRASARFDKNGQLTYELSMPLNQLNFPKNTLKFSYNLKVNGLLANVKIVMLDPNQPVPTAGEMSLIGTSIHGNSMLENEILNSTTDFWGSYTLAK